MPGTPIQLIYASTSGNTEAVIETVAAELEAHGFSATTYRAEKTSIDVVSQNQLFVFGTSTWEHGALNPFFREYLKQLKQVSCDGKQAAFVGCGDRRYEPVLFCEGIEIIKQVWLGQGGTVIGDVLKIQGEPFSQMDSVITPWAQSLVSAFDTEVSKPKGKLQQMLHL